MNKGVLGKDMSTPENRAFWAVGERACERVRAWPEWKRNLKVLRAVDEENEKERS
jgi:hypothetical protein